MNKPFTRDVSSPYGAPMGRTSMPDLSGKVHLARVPIRDGYDPGGAYWGVGTPLWCAWNDEGAIYMRAATREAAKAFLGAGFKFYR